MGSILSKCLKPKSYDACLERIHYLKKVTPKKVDIQRTIQRSNMIRKSLGIDTTPPSSGQKYRRNSFSIQEKIDGWQELNKHDMLRAIDAIFVNAPPTMRN